MELPIAGSLLELRLTGFVDGLRAELRRPGTRLVGSAVNFPERYGEELIPPALNTLGQKPAQATNFAKHPLLIPRNGDPIYPLDKETLSTPAANADARQPLAVH
jgi:hypothetical protein